MKTSVLLVLAALALGSCRKAATEAVAAPLAEALPTQVLKSFEMNDLKNGVKSMSLSSIEARVFEEQKTANVDHPIVHFYKDGRASSLLTAPAGKIHMETHAVEAWGGVRVVSSDSSTLTTERMRYHPDTRKIVSEDAVHLEKPDSMTDGVGFETDPELTHTIIRHQKVRFKRGMKP